MNYDKKMIETINSWDSKPKLLLHSCCGPCSTAVIERLKDYADITVIYYNPNIEPIDEYRKRKREQLKVVEKLGIKYREIKPHTPKQNGRVERSHRKDQERFYYKKVFYSLEDLSNRGADWRKEYNNFPMRPLGWLSPKEFLKKYKSQGESVITI